MILGGPPSGAAVRHRFVALLLAAAVVLGLAGCGTPASGSQDAGCADLTVPVRYQVDPRTRAGVFTTSPAAADEATAAGYTADDGTVFRVAGREVVHFPAVVRFGV